MCRIQMIEEEAGRGSILRETKANLLYLDAGIR